MVAWRPQNKPWDPPNTWRWPGWPAFLADWAAVRAEYLSVSDPRRPGQRPLFADRAAAYARRYGLEALDASEGRFDDDDDDRER